MLMTQLVYYVDGKFFLLIEFICKLLGNATTQAQGGEGDLGGFQRWWNRASSEKQVQVCLVALNCFADELNSRKDLLLNIFSFIVANYRLICSTSKINECLCYFFFQAHFETLCFFHQQNELTPSNYENEPAPFCLKLLEQCTIRINENSVISLVSQELLKTYLL